MCNLHKNTYLNLFDISLFCEYNDHCSIDLAMDLCPWTSLCVGINDAGFTQNHFATDFSDIRSVAQIKNYIGEMDRVFFMQKLLERTVGIHGKKRILIYSASIAMLLALIIVSAVVLNTNALSLNENNTKTVVTGAKTGSQNIDYENIDMLTTTPYGENGSLKSVSVTVKADGKKEKVTLKGATVKDALLEANILLFNEDAVEPELDASLSDGDVITVTRAKNVTVVADGEKHTVKLAKGTVKDAISAANVTVGKDDEVSKKLDKSLKDGMTIKVSRVTYKQKTVTEEIKYKTVTTESKSMKNGKTKVTQKGVNGEKEVTYKIKYVDGKQSDKSVVSEKAIKKAVNKKITVGTKGASSKGGKAPSQISWIAPPSSVKFDASGKPTNYKKIMTGTATAYGPKDGTATSTGKKAKPGYVAVDPKVIPYGTKMYIVSADGKYNYGYAIAADTGGAARSGRIIVDLFFSSNGACYDFGRRQVNIYILP